MTAIVFQQFLEEFDHLMRSGGRHAVLLLNMLQAIYFLPTYPVLRNIPDDL